jgi:hypothetical protein
MSDLVAEVKKQLETRTIREVARELGISPPNLMTIALGKAREGTILVAERGAKNAGWPGF